MAFKRRGGFQRSSARQIFWERSTDITGYTTLGAATAVIAQSLTAVDPITLVRTRGKISVVTDQAGGAAVDEGSFGAIGMCVVSDQALAIGVTAVPTLITDKDSDLWLLHEYFFASVLVGTNVGFSDVSSLTMFDSKAMRKISEDQSLIVVVENAAASHGMKFAVQFATLFKVAKG